MAAEPTPKPLPVVRVCGYPRKSPLGGGKEAEDSEERSLEGQEQDMRDWCERMGPVDGCVYQLVEVRPETDRRYWLKGRDVLMQILDECKLGLYDLVLIWDITRFVGKASHIGWLQTEFDEAGVTFRSIHNDPGTGKFAPIMQTMQAFGSEQELDSIVLRIRKGKRDRHTARRAQPFPAPYGTVWNHVADPDSAPTRKLRCVRLVADPRPAGQAALAVVRGLFAEKLEDDRPSANELARRLTTRGTPSPRGKHWTPGAVNRILRNAAYRGDYVYFRTIRTKVGKGAKEHWEQLPRDKAEWLVWEGHHEQFVDPDVFDRVQAVIDEGPHFQTRTAIGERFLLRGGLARCAHCDRPLTNGGTWDTVRPPGGAFEPGDRVPFYICASYRTVSRLKQLAGREAPCTKPTRIRADALDRAVWEALLDRAHGPRRERANVQTQRAEEARKDAHRLTREVERKREALARVERKVAEEPDEERRRAQDALAASYAAEIKTLEVQRAKAAERAIVSGAQSQQAQQVLALFRDHYLRMVTCVPWGDDPSQDAVMKSVLRSVQTEVVVRGRGGRKGPRGGYEALMDEAPWEIDFRALAPVAREGEAEKEGCLSGTSATSGRVPHLDALAAALAALPPPAP